MASKSGFGSARHLAVRFFGALSPAGPPPDDERWALDSMLPGERELWNRMSGADRRHAVGVARDTAKLLDDGSKAPAREVTAAALLHDVGKVEAQIGTFSRVGVTLLAVAVGRERVVSTARRRRAPRWLRRADLYLRHDSLGAAMLSDAGSDPLTTAWAGEHHMDPSRWSVDRRLADALKAADGD